MAISETIWCLRLVNEWLKNISERYWQVKTKVLREEPVLFPPHIREIDAGHPTWLARNKLPEEQLTLDSSKQLV